MAKIIKHGSMYNKQITCRRCGCEFIPEKEDIHYPTINPDNIADDGSVHLSILRDVKGLQKKNPGDRFYIFAEMTEYLTPEIVCPECGESKTLQPELIVFSDDDEIWVTDDPILHWAIEKDTADDSPSWDVSRMLVQDNTYSCMRLDLRNMQYYPANVRVMRPDTKAHKDIYEDIRIKIEETGRDADLNKTSCLNQ